MLLFCFSAQLHLQLIYQTFPFLHSKETFWHICKFDLSLESILLFQMKTNRKLVGKRQNREKKTKIALNVFVFLLLMSCLLIILINHSALRTLISKSVTTSLIKFSGTSKKENISPLPQINFIQQCHTFPLCFGHLEKCSRESVCRASNVENPAAKNPRLP